MSLLVWIFLYFMTLLLVFILAVVAFLAAAYWFIATVYNAIFGERYEDYEE